MTTAFRGLTTLAAALVSAMATPAMADLPAPVRTMLDAAIASGNDAEIAAVAKFAKSTNPADSAEIDALVSAHRVAVAAADEAHKRAAGFFQNWHGNGELGGFLTTGNSETSGITVGLALDKEGIDWRHKIRAIADYQRADGVTTRNQWLASYEPNYNVTARLYTFGLAMYEKDRFQGFSDRVTLSGGMGYRVIDSDAMTLDIKGGPAWRRTDWIAEPSTSKFNGLAGADFVWHISPALDFSNNAQALWGDGNSTYSNTAALTAKLSGALSGRLSYGVRHETNPPAINEKTDTVTRATLVYGF
ncbi:MAG TPA: DUF481 domain-containing protein [Sphingobium sp.]|nr:DUF481 domain-containing protein [Sphingobium sp.]